MVTNTKVLLDSEQKEGTGIPLQTFVMNSQFVIWTIRALTRDAVHEYRFATQQATVLMIPVDGSYASLFLAGNTLYFEIPTQPANIPYLWNLDQTTPPVQLPFEVLLNSTFNGNYIITDSINFSGPSNPLTLYNIVTGKLTKAWGPRCIRPGIAPDRPYAICIDYDASTWELVRIPSGASTPFAVGEADIGAFGYNQIVNGNVYWLPLSNLTTSNHSNNQVDYFTLPTT